jgi:hypothetical protein
MGRGIAAKQSGKHGTAFGLALVAAEQARPVKRALIANTINTKGSRVPVKNRAIEACLQI